MAAASPLLVLTDPLPYPGEQPANLLHLSPETQVGMAPYVSPEEKVRLAEEEERRRREKEANKDDAPERAIQDMMGGTLEAKDEVTVLREKTVKAPWMDAIPEEKFNSDQRAAWAERAAAVVALEELLERRRIEVNLEMNRLAGELRDIVATFDERLGALGKQRKAVAASLAALDLYRSHLVCLVHKRAVHLDGRSHLRSGESYLSSEAETAGALYAAHATLCSGHARKVEELGAEDRALEKSFRQSILTHITEELLLAPPSNATLKVLISLFKKRTHRVSLKQCVATPTVPHPDSSSEQEYLSASLHAQQLFQAPLTSADLPEE